MGRVASVASFFISRIDTAVDRELAARLAMSANGAEQARLRSLQGTVAIANAKCAYQRYRRRFSGSRWERLAAQGAMTQRLLWASTGTKNPAYRNVIYVEELIGPDTVNTVPPATLEAFRAHGLPQNRLMEGSEQAAETLRALDVVGIAMPAITDRLLDEGVQVFKDAFDQLLAAMAPQGKASLSTPVTPCAYALPASLTAAVRASLKDWEEDGRVSRLVGARSLPLDR